MPYLHCHKKRLLKKYLDAQKLNYFKSVSNKNLQYEGYWRDGLKHGFGVLSEVISNRWNKLKYQGTWSNNKRNGHGCWYFKDGGYYLGEWRCSKRHGNGSMWYNDGSFYDGSWKNGEKSGLGLYVQVNGNRYEGEWKNNKKHGYGRFFFLDTGQMQDGQWENNSAVDTTIVDIPYRQTAVFCTQYPIPPLISELIQK